MHLWWITRTTQTFLLKWLEKYPFIGRIYILIFGIISFVIFDSASLWDAVAHIGAMFGVGTVPFMTEVTNYYLDSYKIIFLIAVIGATPVVKRFMEKIMEYKMAKILIEVLEPIIMIGILVVATGYLVDGSFNPFLYFRF